jgi:hypothetical protein
MSETATTTGLAYVIVTGPHRGREGMIAPHLRKLRLLNRRSNTIEVYERGDALVDDTLAFYWRPGQTSEGLR